MSGLRTSAGELEAAAAAAREGWVTLTIPTRPTSTSTQPPGHFLSSEVILTFQEDQLESRMAVAVYAVDLAQRRHRRNTLQIRGENLHAALNYKITSEGLVFELALSTGEPSLMVRRQP